MNRLFWFLGILLASPIGYAELDRPHPLEGNRAIDVQHYRISVDASQLDFTRRFCDNYELPVKAEITLTAKADVASIDLHFNPQASKLESLRDSDTNQPLKYDIRDLGQGYRYLSIQRAMSAGQKAKIEVVSRVVSSGAADLPFGGYFKQPFNCQGNQFFLDSYAYNFRSFLPSNDVLLDGATNEFIIRTPLNAVAGANGKLLKGTYADGDVDEGSQTRTFHWRQEQTISTSVMSFILTPRSGVPVEAAPYAGKIPVVAWAAYHPQQLAWISSTVKSLEDFIGPYPFAKIGVMGEGGMEYANIMRGNFAHELIHQWWGNTVRPETLGDGWISEGFTTYYDDVIKRLNDPNGGTSLDLSYPPCNERACTKLNADFYVINLLYQEGARCLHRLRALVLGFTNENPADLKSTSVFFSFLKEYYRRFSGDSVSSIEFVQYVKDNLPAHLKKAEIVFDEKRLSDAIARWQSDFFRP